jgi:hypothetical protein
MSVSAFLDVAIANLGLLNLEGAEYVKGDSSSATTGSPPRVTFIVGGPAGRDEFLGARQHASFPAAGGRSVLTHLVNVQARVWADAMTVDGEAKDATDATIWLLHRTVVALRTAGYGSIRFRGGDFISESVAFAGRLYVLDFAVELPVLETPMALVQPTAADVEGVAAFGTTEVASKPPP